MSNPLTALLIDAIVIDNCDAVRMLLEQGADPNGFLDEDNVTPLHFAAEYNSIGSAQLLLAAGADREAETALDGETPLDIALLHQHKEVIRLLTMVSHTSSTTAH